MIIQEKHKWIRWIIGIAAIGSILIVYVFQRKLFWGQEYDQLQYLSFIVNRVVRLIINDSLCLLLFIAIFNRKQELKLASMLFAIELFLILPLYLLIKLTLEGDAEISAPLLSFIHRLIVNPLLMIILLGGFLYQRYRIQEPG
jgi:exosortase F-associated protein